MKTCATEGCSNPKPPDRRICDKCRSAAYRAKKRGHVPEKDARHLETLEAVRQEMEHAPEPAEPRPETDAERRQREAAERKAREQRERWESDFDPLKPEDFNVGVANEAALRDPNYTKEKRQEFNRRMGRYANSLHRAADAAAHGGEMLDEMTADDGEYLAALAEQERRMINRREARKYSLADAQEELARRRFFTAASKYLRDKVVPTGYAAKPPSEKPKRRIVNLLISDLHIGADLRRLDEPIAFGAIQEARRLEFLLREVCDYKPQYRDVTTLNLLFNGDLVEGMLLHDMRGGIALTEQKIALLTYLRDFIGFCSQCFPWVNNYWQPGNHGRDKVRHQGRATSRKWDGHEWELGWCLREMTSGLPNVRWQIDFRAVTKVDLFGSKLLLTHGDTEVKLGDPDTKAKDNAQAIDRINTTGIYGGTFDAFAFGHFHKPRYQPRNPRVIYNGALIPPNGHARTSGYIGEPCGQFLWESVEGYPVGDVRFLEVGERQDHDEKLGTLIEPFRFEE